MRPYEQDGDDFFAGRRIAFDLVEKRPHPIAGNSCSVALFVVGTCAGLFTIWMVGLIALVVGVMVCLIHNMRVWRPIAIGAAASVLFGYSVLTWHQRKMYSDLETLWLRTLEKNPSAAMPHNNIGILFMEKGRISDAVFHFHRAIEIRPDYADAHYNLGNALLDLGRNEEAAGQYGKVLQIGSMYPDTRNNLAIALNRMGRMKQAIALLEKEIRIHPHNAAAYFNLGMLFKRERKAEKKALFYFQRAYQIDPAYTSAHYQAGNILHTQGMTKKAAVRCLEVLKRNPNHADAYLKMRMIYEELGKDQSAAHHFAEVIRNRPDDYAAHMKLGETYFRLGFDKIERLGKWNGYLAADLCRFAKRRAAQYPECSFKPEQNELL